MKTIYLASRYQDFPLMNIWAEKLRSIGYIISSRWIKGDHEITTNASSDEQRMKFAMEDIEDITIADIIICRSDPSFFRSGRGGRHVELGIAIALGKEIFLIGEPENVFHWLPQIQKHANFDSCFSVLNKNR